MMSFPDNEVNFTTRFHDVSVQVSDIAEYGLLSSQLASQPRVNNPFEAAGAL